MTYRLATVRLHQDALASIPSWAWLATALRQMADEIDAGEHRDDLILVVETRR